MWSADMAILIDMPIFASHGLKMLSIEGKLSGTL
jgi:hypothetical protein